MRRVRPSNCLKKVDAKLPSTPSTIKPGEEEYFVISVEFPLAETTANPNSLAVSCVNEVSVISLMYSKAYCDEH